MFFHRVSGVFVAPCDGSPYPRTWHGEKSTVSTANGCRHGGKGDEPRMPPKRRQRHGGGEDTPSEPESLVGDDKEEDEYGVEGKVTPPPHAPPHESLPSLGDIFSRQAGITVSAR
jgi:hypothetical protein